MDNLPDEIVLNVFSFLCKHQLTTTVPLVCRRWRFLYTDPSLYRHLVLTKSDPDTAAAIHLLRMSPWLSSLELSGRADTDILVQHVGTTHPRLRSFVLHYCRGTRSKRDLSSFHLKDLLERCKGLTHFAMRRTRCDSSLLYSEVGSKLVELKVFEISSFQIFDSSSLLSFANNCQRLEEILIADSGYAVVSDKAIVNFCDRFKDSLRNVVFDNTLWTDESLTALSRCHRVTELRLRHTGDVTDMGILAIGDMPNLVSLVVRDSENISSMGWVRLFQRPLMKRLKKISLSYGNVDDEVFRAIALLPNLEDLSVWGDRVTDEGLWAISYAPKLVHLRMTDAASVTTLGWTDFFRVALVAQMRRLWLCYCKNVNDEVAHVIAKNLRCLELLHLLECDISFQGHCQVKKYLPYYQFGI